MNDDVFCLSFDDFTLTYHDVISSHERVASLRFRIEVTPQVHHWIYGGSIVVFCGAIVHAPIDGSSPMSSLRREYAFSRLACEVDWEMTSPRGSAPNGVAHMNGVMRWLRLSQALVASLKTTSAALGSACTLFISGVTTAIAKGFSEWATDTPRRSYFSARMLPWCVHKVTFPYFTSWKPTTTNLKEGHCITY